MKSAKTAIFFPPGNQGEAKVRQASVCRDEGTISNRAQARNLQDTQENDQSDAFFLPCSV